MCKPKRDAPDLKWADWTWQMRHAIRKSDDLADILDLDCETRSGMRLAAARYPLCVTPYYLSLAQSGSLTDPIIRQILPDQRELESSPPGSQDPLGEADDSPVPGVVHRYPDRALLVLTDSCAVHCRHCMRKRQWDTRWNTDDHVISIDKALAYIAARDEIHEVLLSGGDPLLLPDDRLDDILARLHAIPHVDVVRIGSRIPVVLPQRLTPSFCEILGRHGTVWLATHFNHAAELSDESAAGIRNLLAAGIPTVNQTVLLKGVNDNAACLRDLCRGLVKQRIKPYYLFHGDPVRGTLHFRTGLDAGMVLVEELRRTLSGLAQPVYAFDLPDGGGKVRLEPDVARGPSSQGTPRFLGCRGEIVDYPDGSE